MDRNHHHAMSLIPMQVAVQVLKEVLHSFVSDPCCTLHSERCLLQAMVAHILLPHMGQNQTTAEFFIHSEKCYDVEH
jgi:predicted benzoate:H+ symporter BenE